MFKPALLLLGLLAACNSAPADDAELSASVTEARPEVRYYMVADTWPFCIKVSAAVRELEQEYGEEADFVIIPAEETAESADELELYGFTELKHGLVVFDGEGDPIVKLPGHMFGREEIEAGLQLVLGT